MHYSKFFRNLTKTFSILVLSAVSSIAFAVGTDGDGVFVGSDAFQLDSLEYSETDGDGALDSTNLSTFSSNELSQFIGELNLMGKLDSPLMDFISRDYLDRSTGGSGSDSVGGAAQTLYKVLIIPRKRLPAISMKSSLADLNQGVKVSTDRVLKVVKNKGDFKLTRRFKSINAIAATVTLEGLRKLSADSSVVSVGLDSGGRGGLNQARPQVNIDHVRQTYGYTGNGIEVAVLDSGIDTDHVDLQSMILSQKCFADDCPNGPNSAEDDNGHGTHVSGIIASQGNFAPKGGSPGVKIHAVKVLDSNGSYERSSTVLSGLDHVINELPSVDLVNMSLGSNDRFSSDCDDTYSYTQALSSAINTLRERGVLSFVSSGNDADNDHISAPACIANAIAVGAVYDTNPQSYYSDACTELNPTADTLTCFSNSSVSVDIVAPGSPITSTRLGGGATIYSGTSMATPLAVSCAALIMEFEPTVTAEEVESLLESSRFSIQDDDGRNFPRLDCLAFLGSQDTDDDGVADVDDAFPLNSSESSDYDGDGIGDNADTDDGVWAYLNNAGSISITGCSSTCPSQLVIDSTIIGCR